MRSRPARISRRWARPTGSAARPKSATSACVPRGSAPKTSWSSPRPTIAAVNGPVAGFALRARSRLRRRARRRACEARVLLQQDRLRAGRGLSWILPRLVGLSRAKELFFRGATIGAKEAAELGLVSRVVADDALAEETRTLAKEIAGRPATALRFGKAIFESRARGGLPHGRRARRRTRRASSARPRSTKAAVRAFVEKKKG